MKVTLEIQRFVPGSDTEPRFECYDVTVEPTDRVLDALIYISRHVDGTLGFRKSCAHGVCGSDAMRIAGKERLACKTLFQDLTEKDGDTIRIEPLRHMPIQRDLMVDQETFLSQFRKVKPFFIPSEAPPKDREFLQSAEDREFFDDATKCISCAACYSACPVLENNPDFLGPTALVHAARFIFDSRDKGLSERLVILDQPNGVWACDNHFECTRVCPREIKITKLINQTKRTITKFKESAKS